jgi:cytidine deaminase
VSVARRSGRGWDASSDDHDDQVPVDIDWDHLRTVAIDAAARAYAPYSRYRVGAAALVSDGRVVAGCNVENASYGVTLCAECGLVSELHMTGGGQLVAFVCVNGEGETIMPCGRCRQLLFEHAIPGMLLETVSGIRTIDEVLPDAFGPRDLDARPNRESESAR